MVLVEEGLELLQPRGITRIIGLKGLDGGERQLFQRFKIANQIVIQTFSKKVWRLTSLNPVS